MLLQPASTDSLSETCSNQVGRDKPVARPKTVHAKAKGPGRRAKFYPAEARIGHDFSRVRGPEKGGLPTNVVSVLCVESGHL